jgi:hypothetical protein
MDVCDVNHMACLDEEDFKLLDSTHSKMLRKRLQQELGECSLARAILSMFSGKVHACQSDSSSLCVALQPALNAGARCPQSCVSHCA